MKTTIKVPAGALDSLQAALADLSQNRLPLMLAVRVNRQAQAVGEFLMPWLEQRNPLVARYIDGRTTLGPGHPRHPEFLADPEVQELYAQEAELEIESISMASLETASELAVRPESLAVLLELGFLEEADPKPKKKPPRKKGA